jgi:predicted  nucleic acid-binding Zn-ribbon protein
MTADLDAPGFEVFQAIAPRSGVAAKPVQPRATKRAAKVVSCEAIAGARRAVAEAEHAAATHREEMHHAETELQQVVEAVTAAEAEVARARRALEEAEKRVEQARREVPRQEQRVSVAKARAAEAFAAVERARAALDEARKRR